MYVMYLLCIILILWQLWHSAPPGMAVGCCGLGLSRCLGPGECLHSFIHTNIPAVDMYHTNIPVVVMYHTMILIYR